MLDEYFTDNCSISLESVNYERLDEFEEEVTLNIQDSLNINERSLNSNFIEVIISRNLSFVPASLVDITVSFGVTLELNEKYKEAENLDYDTIRSELIDKNCLITSIVMSRISLIISQLTSSYGERPIVTPPSFMANE